MACVAEAEGFLFNENWLPGIVHYSVPRQDTREDKIAFGFMTNEPNGTIIRLHSGVKPNDYIEAKLVSLRERNAVSGWLGSLSGYDVGLATQWS